MAKASALLALLVGVCVGTALGQTTSVSDVAGPKVIVPSKATPQAYVLNADGSLSGFSTTNPASDAFNCSTPSGLASSGAQSLTLAVNDRRGTTFQTGQATTGPALVGRGTPNGGSGCANSAPLPLGGNAANALLSAHDANQDYLFVVSAGAPGKPDTLSSFYTAGVFPSGGTPQATGQQNLDTGGTYTSLVVDENSSNSDAIVTELRTSTSAGGTWFYNKFYDRMIRILGPGGVDLPAVNSFIIHNPTDGGGELLVLVNQDGITAANILDPPVDSTPFTIIDLGWLHDLAVAKNNPATLTLPSVTNINSSLGYYAMLGAVYNRGDQKIYAVVVTASSASNIQRLVVRYDPSNPGSPAETVVNDVSSVPLNGSQYTQLAINGASGTLQMLAKDSNRLFTAGITGSGGAVSELTGTTFSDNNFLPVSIASNTLLGETYIASTAQVDVLTRPAANKMQVYLDLLGSELRSAVGAGGVYLLGVFPDPSDTELYTTNITITATPQGGSPYTFATTSAYSTLRIPTLVTGNFPNKGIYTLVATFPGDSMYAAATSAPVTIAVGQPIFTTTTTATGTFNNSTGSGVAAVTLGGATYAPTGTITLTSVDTGATLTTYRLTGGLSNPINITFTAPTSTTGIAATYSGDSKHAASNSGNVALTIVGLATPVITLTGPATSTAGQQVPLNIKFTSTSTATPTGNFTIFGSSPTQSRFVVGAVNASAAFASGGTSFNWTPPTAGTFTFEAFYDGDGNYNAVDTAAGSIVISVATYAFTISAPSSASAGSSFNVTVNASSAAGAMGLVTLYAVKQGTSAQILLGTVDAQVAANGGATLAASLPNSGVYAISGSYSGDGSFAASTSTNSPTIVISGGTTPAVTITPPSASFTAAVGSSSPQQNFKLYNTGGVALNISGITVNGAGFSQLNGCPAALQSGNSCTISITFSPSVMGTVNGNLSITDNATGSPHLVTLTGIAAPSAASITPTSSSFIDTTVGTSAYNFGYIRLSNQGAAPFSIGTITLSDTTNFEIVTNGCGAVGPLDPGAHCDVAVEFHPTTAGAKSTTVTLNTSNSTLPLIGTMTGNGLVRGTCPDADGDGLCDDWETHGVYVRTSSTTEKFVDLPSMGADPKHKDIFVQADYMATDVLPVGEHSHQMTVQAAYDEQVSFDNAPVSNPDGKTGIHLHVDCGFSCVMDPVTKNRWGNASLAAEIAEQTYLDNIHTGQTKVFDWTAFDQASKPFVNSGRSLVFHHAIFAHMQNSQNGSSGLSRNDDNNFGLGASDVIVSFGSWTSVVGTDMEQAGTLMHELGHNLALHHGGDDDNNRKPNYLSVMNYNYQTTGVIRDNGDGFFDYSRFNLPLLDELHLDEGKGFNADPKTYIGANGEAIDKYGVFFFCTGDDPIKKGPQVVFNVDGNINWDCDAKKIISNTTVKSDTNADGGYNELDKNNKYSFLSSFNDWPALVYGGGSIGGQGAGSSIPTTTQATEITQVEDSLIPKPYTVAIQGMGRVHTAPNSQMTLTFAITNKGIFDDTYALSATMQNGWTINTSVPATATIAAGKTAMVSVTYTVPATAANGDKDVLTVSAVSQHFGTVSDSRAVGLYATSTPFPDVVSTGNLTFGAKVVGSTSTVQGVVILNTGGSALSFGTIATTAEFAQTNTCGTSLAAGASCVVGVTFTPSTAGNRTGTLTINDGTGAAKTVTLAGTAVAPALPIPSVTLAATPSSTSTGQTVTFNVSVAGTTSPVPTGTVTIYNGTTQVGQATLDGAGSATVSTSTLSAGTYSLLATYSGDAAFGGATSPYAALTIVAATPTTVALTSSAASAASGSSVTFTATVGGGSGASHPTGTVRFLDGTNQVGTGTLDANGVATFTTSALANGAHSITASYGGDNVFGASVSSALTETIGTFATTNKLTASATTPVVGTSVTFTATLTATSGTPTGSVTFLDGATTLGTGTLNGTGVATFSTSSLAIGTHSITAQYAATGNFGASTSSAVQVVVTGVPDFSITANPTSLTVTSGSSATATFTVTPANGYAGTVSLSCGTLPSYATCSFAPAKLTFTSSSQTAQTATLSFNTTQTTGAMRRELFQRGPAVFFAGTLPLGLLALGLGWRDRRRHLRLMGRLMLVVVAAGVVTLSGCGGPAAVPSTPAGTYTVPINVTDGTTAHTLSYSITVK